MEHLDFSTLMPAEFIDPTRSDFDVPQGTTQRSASFTGTPTTENLNERIMISTSATFATTSCHGNVDPETIILASSDHVHFYVHIFRLLSASTNNFNQLLPTPHRGPEMRAIAVFEDAATLNVVLHAIYDISLRQFSPHLEVLLAAVDALKKYGIPLDQYLVRRTPLFEELVIKTPYRPIEVYIVAAENDLFDLASEASSFLLSYPLSSVTDDMWSRIGPLYLRRLFTLHVERLQVLQQLIVQPPPEHPPTLDCGWVDHKRLMNAWSLACASIIFDAQPDLSAGKIRIVLQSLSLHLACGACKDSVNKRVKDIVMKWSITPRTILRDTGGYRAVLR
ncbi:unnamed protein product [Somion occarium]